MRSIMMVKKIYKIEDIRTVESTMLKMHDLLQPRSCGRSAKSMRSIIHHLHQLKAFFDNGSTVAPGQDSCKKNLRSQYPAWL